MEVSHPLNMYTAIRMPPTRPLVPPIPDQENQLHWKEADFEFPPNTATRPTIANTEIVRYSTVARTHWNRAVTLIPMYAMIVTTTSQIPPDRAVANVEFWEPGANAART